MCRTDCAYREFDCTMLTIRFTTVGPDEPSENPGEQVMNVVSDQIDWLELTTRIIAGDEAAFANFYEHFFDRLFRYILVMTHGDEQLSRDLLQKTMLKVVRYLKPFPEEMIVWSWLTQLAKTSFIDLLRSEKREPEFVRLELVSHISQPQAHRDEEDLVLEAALEEAVTLLAIDEKELIHSVYFDELSHKQIAESMRCTPKAVESKLARVRRKLRTLLTTILKDEKNT
jgi:RNA polymerase sigma factor (sigma-70 family)